MKGGATSFCAQLAPSRCHMAVNGQRQGDGGNKGARKNKRSGEEEEPIAVNILNPEKPYEAYSSTEHIHAGSLQI